MLIDQQMENKMFSIKKKKKHIKHTFSDFFSTSSTEDTTGIYKNNTIPNLSTLADN